MATGIWVRASIMFMDYGGTVAKIAVIVAAAAIDPSGTAVSAIRTALEALTKARSPRASTGSGAGPAGSTDTGTGPFSAVEDRATLTFRGDDNSTFTYEIPAPKAVCFLAGTDRVDASGDAMSAYIDYIETNCVGTAEQSLQFEYGFRTRKKQIKR
jgi:hypothetical protein